MRERRRDYEMLFIISPLRSSEEEITNAINRVRQSITAAGGEVTSVDQTAPWGRRKFAYPIREYAEGEASRRPFNEGFYVLCHFSLPTTQVSALERALKLNDSVLRYLMTLVETKSAGAPAVAAVPVGAQAGDDTASDDPTSDEDDDIDSDAEDDSDEQ
ncbi:30S ribosomal protein S6 [Kouleothrix aurantiaca]|uniref:Small ribosomal subunit protein bS6 n=1 Tax=Kouleothrix aurantiaca TaxID=186479 RepID=A0A0P9D8W9_9CHLR|nr:30S ribosomal protein S6 [Kouleothrix aurantiaca]